MAAKLSRACNYLSPCLAGMRKTNYYCLHLSTPSSPRAAIVVLSTLVSLSLAAHTLPVHYNGWWITRPEIRLPPRTLQFSDCKSDLPNLLRRHLSHRLAIPRGAPLYITAPHSFYDEPLALSLLRNVNRCSVILLFRC